MSKIEQDCNVINLMAGKGYSSHVIGKSLLSVEDTGNGYHITQYAFGATYQDMHYSIDYPLANDLRKVLNFLHKKNKEKLNVRV